MDQIIYSIIEESERINKVRLTSKQQDYIIEKQKEREEDFADVIKTLLTQTGERIYKSMILEDTSKPVLTKDMNNGNILLNSSVRHIDFNYLAYEELDVEFVAFYDSFGKRNEQQARRRKFIERMFEIRGMDEDAQQKHYKNAFRHNMNMYSFCMLRSTEVHGEAASIREKVALYKFEKAIEAYSNLNNQDQILLFGMKKELESLKKSYRHANRI